MPSAMCCSSLRTGLSAAHWPGSTLSSRNSGRRMCGNSKQIRCGLRPKAELCPLSRNLLAAHGTCSLAWAASRRKYAVESCQERWVCARVYLPLARDVLLARREMAPIVLCRVAKHRHCLGGCSALALLCMACPPARWRITQHRCSSTPHSAAFFWVLHDCDG